MNTKDEFGRFASAIARFSAPAALSTALVISAFGCTPDADGDGADAVIDCDDSNAAIGPYAAEICDGLDNNCNGLVDEPSEDGNPYYEDFDRDGFGDSEVVSYACVPPYGFVEDASDCDDINRAIHPDADEICDGVDNNCDDAVDDDAAIDRATWYLDSDTDGFGATSETTEACDAPDGYAAAPGDCADDNDQIYPGADEVCDTVDNDCDGDIDEDDAIDAAIWYLDSDADTYGDLNTFVFSCDVSVEGYVDNDQDCDDNNPYANPDGTEVCDGADNDCNSATSEDGMIANADGTSYSTIQDAIDDALSGDTIYVCSGEYYENLYVWQDLTLSGVSDPADTVIDGSELGAVLFNYNLASISLTALTVRNGLSMGSYSAGVDGFNGGDVTIDNCIFEDNEGIYGGAILSSIEEGYTLSVTDSVFTNNSASSGGAIYSFGSTVTDTVFTDNVASFGGAAFLEYTNTLTDVVMISNTAINRGGGAVMYYDSVVTLESSSVSNNIAAYEGGGLSIDGDVDISDSTIDSNQAAESGGGLMIDGSSVTISNSSISGNSSLEVGGGVYVLSAGELELDSVTLNDNTSDLGAAILIEEGDVLLTSCTVTGNTATTAGGGAHLYDSDSYLESDASDWGTGTEDNSPDDVAFDSTSTTYTSFGSGETFICSYDDGTCI